MDQTSADFQPPFLSLVIPAHNEESKIARTLDLLLGWRAGQPFKTEIIVVENGSSDQTAQIVQARTEQCPHLHLIALSDSGKGRAVRHGMLAARGQYRMMLDADLAMPPEEISRFLPPVVQADLAIGSREAPGSEVDCPTNRRLSGRIFNAMVRILLLPGMHDTQCGFKCFTAQAANTLFSQTESESFAFDVEVLYRARQAKLSIVEIPITWRHDPDTRVRLFRDSLNMFVEIFRMRRRLH